MSCKRNEDMPADLQDLIHQDCARYGMCDEVVAAAIRNYVNGVRAAPASGKNPDVGVIRFICTAENPLDVDAIMIQAHTALVLGKNTFGIETSGHSYRIENGQIVASAAFRPANLLGE